MNTRNYVIIITIILGISSCKNQKKEDIDIKKTEIFSSDLQIDHLNIWVKNPKKAKSPLFLKMLLILLSFQFWTKSLVIIKSRKSLIMEVWVIYFWLLE